MKPGDSINGYTLRKSCGKGAFGEVFLAESFMGQKVALKIVKFEGKSADRELQALKDYIKCCPNEYLMTVSHADQKDDFFFYVMELADSLDNNSDSDEFYVADTLQNRLQKNGPLSVQETTDLAIQLLSGIKILHSHNLIHRDIKPANILWIHGQAKLGDIGLLAHDNSLTCPAGTPGFMPPPFLGIRNNSPQMDLYALAQVLYCCLSGMRDTGLDGLELTDDLENNGQALLRTINLVCSKNSPIQTADQFLTALTEPTHTENLSSQTSISIMDESKSAIVPGNTDSLNSYRYPYEADKHFPLEPYHDDHSVTSTILKAGIPMAAAMIPGAPLVAGVTVGTTLLAKGLFDFLNKDLDKDREIEDLRYQRESIEWQKEDMRRQLESTRRQMEDTRRQMEDIERQRRYAEQMNKFLSDKMKKDSAGS